MLQNNQHCEHVLAAFRHRAHVFCEKPIATTAQDCWTLVKVRLRAFWLHFYVKLTGHHRPSVKAGTGVCVLQLPLRSSARDAVCCSPRASCCAIHRCLRSCVKCCHWSAKSSQWRWTRIYCRFMVTAKLSSRDIQLIKLHTSSLTHAQMFRWLHHDQLASFHFAFGIAFG